MNLLSLHFTMKELDWWPCRCELNPAHATFESSWLYALFYAFNPFKPNGTSYTYQLDQSILVQGMWSGTFPFYSNFERTFCNQTVENLFWRVCNVCICLTKIDARLYVFWNKTR